MPGRQFPRSAGAGCRRRHIKWVSVNHAYHDFAMHRSRKKLLTGLPFGAAASGAYRPRLHQTKAGCHRLPAYQGAGAYDKMKNKDGSLHRPTATEKAIFVPPTAHLRRKRLHHHWASKALLWRVLDVARAHQVGALRSSTTSSFQPGVIVGLVVQ